MLIYPEGRSEPSMRAHRRGQSWKSRLALGLTRVLLLMVEPLAKTFVCEKYLDPPMSLSIKGLMVSIRWYSGCLKG